MIPFKIISVWLLILTNFNFVILAENLDPSADLIPSSRLSLNFFTSLAVQIELLAVLTKHLNKYYGEPYGVLLETVLDLQRVIHSREVHLLFCGRRHGGDLFIDSLSNAFQYDTADPWVQRIDYRRFDVSKFRRKPPGSIPINQETVKKYFNDEILEIIRAGGRIFASYSIGGTGIDRYRNRMNKYIIEHVEKLIVECAKNQSGLRELKCYHSIFIYTDNDFHLGRDSLTISAAYLAFIKLPTYKFSKNEYAKAIGMK